MQHRTVEAGGAPSARDGRCLGRHHEPQGRSRGIDALIRADSWAFLQVRHLEALLYCRLSGARLRPGFHLPISSALADIFCFDPLMARERHLVWACRLPDPAIALAARRLQLAESWPGHAGTAAHSRIALSRPCILLIAGIFRRYNARQADGFAPSPNP